MMTRCPVFFQSPIKDWVCIASSTINPEQRALFIPPQMDLSCSHGFHYPHQMLLPFQSLLDPCNANRGLQRRMEECLSPAIPVLFSVSGKKKLPSMELCMPPWQDGGDGPFESNTLANNKENIFILVVFFFLFACFQRTEKKKKTYITS